MTKFELSDTGEYKSHKKVFALKIEDIITNKDGAVISPTQHWFVDFPVTRTYMEKHNPKIGGYYVEYDDGYESFSPAEAFEQGYCPLQ